jgi:hypothetical protein
MSIEDKSNEYEVFSQNWNIQSYLKKYGIFLASLCYFIFIILLHLISIYPQLLISLFWFWIFTYLIMGYYFRKKMISLKDVGMLGISISIGVQFYIILLEPSFKSLFIIIEILFVFFVLLPNVLVLIFCWRSPNKQISNKKVMFFMYEMNRDSLITIILILLIFIPIIILGIMTTIYTI